MMGFANHGDGDLGQTMQRTKTRRGWLGKRRRRTFHGLERLEDRTLLSFNPIAQPGDDIPGTTTVYTSGTTNLESEIPAPPNTTTSLTDGTETISLSQTMTAYQTTALGWGSPPATENASPLVLYTTSTSPVTLSLSQPAAVLGLEVQPRLGLTQTVTADFYDGAMEVGTISKSIATGGAVLFAASTDQLFTSVVLSASGLSGISIAEPRYSLPTADLGITKAVSPSQLFSGQNATYTINLSNAATADAALGTTVTDPLPAGTVFESETDPGGSWSVSTPGVGNPGTVTFTDASLFAAGATASFTITVQATAAAPATLDNTATATATNSNTASDSASFMVVSPTVSLTGNTFVIERDSANPNYIDVTTDGVLYQQLASLVQQINLTGAPGNDSLTVDSVNGLITAPINYNASTNGDNTLILTQTAGPNNPTLTSDVVQVGAGPSPSQGQSVIMGSDGTQTVSFYNISPFFDDTPAPSLELSPQIPASLLNASNAINYTEGVNKTTLLVDPTWGQVTVDSFEPLNFQNKGTLIIDSGPGVDQINIDNSNVPTGLAGITVNGGGTAWASTLSVDGTGGQALGYTPTAPGSGAVMMAIPLPTVSFTGIANLSIVGDGAGDQLTVTAPAGSQVTLTPGSTVDSGTVAITSGGAFTPLAFSNLGPADPLGSPSGSFLAVVGAGATLVYDGTTSNDTFTVLGNTTPGVGGVSLASSANPLVSQIPVYTGGGVTNLVLNGISGDDTFNVTASTLLPLPYTGITLEGNNSDPATLTGDGTSPVVVTVGATTTTVTGGGLGSVTVSGVGVINVDAGTAGATVDGTAGNDNFTYSPTTGTSGTLTLPGGPAIDFTNVGAAGLSVDAPSGTVTVDAPAGPQPILVTQGATATTTTVQVGATLGLSLVSADTGSLVIAGGLGSDTLTVDSTNAATAGGLKSIVYNGGSGGGNSLILEGGTAITDSYTAGSTAGAGSSAIAFGAFTQTVAFTNLSPFYDSVTARVLTVNVNGSNNAIIYQEGDDTTGTLNPAWGRVAVNNGEPINFTGKAGGVVISALAGSNDTLTVNGTGGQAIGYTPSTPGSGGVTVGTLPTVSFVGISDLSIIGDGTGDPLTVNAPAGSQVTLTPGSAVDSGTVSITSGGAAPVSFTPLDFSNLGPVATSSLTISGAGSFIYDGTTGNDTFNVATAGAITLSNTSTGVAQISVSAPGVTDLVLNGISGDDTFDVHGGQPYAAIALQGGPSDPSVAHLRGDGTSAVAVTLGATTTTVTGGGLNSITLSGVGVINVGADGAGVNVAGVAGNDNFTYTPNPTISSAGTVTLPSGPTLDVWRVAAAGLSIDAPGGKVTVDVPAGAQSITAKVVGASSTVTVTGTLPLNLAAAATLVVAGGAGNDALTVDSSNAAFPIGILFNGVSGNNNSLILTGTASADTYDPTNGVITSDTETVGFTGVTAVFDSVDPTSLTVLANGSSNAISYTEGSAPGGPLNPAWGRVSVDNLAPINFTAKGTLNIIAEGGSDEISLNNQSSTPPVTGVNVVGGNPTASDTLVVNGVAGAADALFVQPTGVGSGTVTDTPQASFSPVTFSGIENLTIVGQAGDGDSLSVGNTVGSDTVVYTPGATLDSGEITGTSTGAPAATFAYTPITFSGITGSVMPIVAVTTTTADHLVVNGTTGNDTFTFTGAANSSIQVDNYTKIFYSPPALGTGDVTLNGLGGVNTFNIIANAAESALPIAVEGNGTGDTINFTAIAGATTTVDYDNSTINPLGSNPISFNAVGTINVIANSGPVRVVGNDSFTYTPLTLNSGTVTAGATQPGLGLTGASGLTIDPLGGSNSVTVDVPAGTQSITASGGSSPVVTVTGALPLNLVAADTQSLTIAGGAGNDALTVDSTAGAFGIPIITFNGGSGGTNSLALTDSLHTGTSATYTPGPAAGAGSYVLGGVAGTETINFTNLSPVYDSVAGVLTVDVNNTNSTVTYGQGNGPVPSPGTNWGEVSVGSLEGINFTHKTSLIIAAPGGNDAINLSSPSAANTPSGLTGITVTGDTSATDTLLVNGVAALSTVYTATSPGAGSVAVGALPGISFSGIGGLAINGQAGGGLLTVSTPAGGQVTLSPGSAVDSGTVAITSGGPAPVSFTPLDFSNLGAAGSLIVSGAGTLVYDGTASSDAFTVTGANTPAGVVGKVVLANSASPAVSQIPVYTTASVTNLVLNGAAGQASFTVTATPLALPYSTGITLEGGSSDASVANLNGNGSTGVTATLGVTAPSAVTTITGGGLGTLANPLTLTGVGVINVNANTAGATVDGTSANDSFTYSPTTASSGTVTLPGSPVVNFTNVAASGLTIDPLGGSNSVTVDVPAGTQSITASGGSSPVVTVTGALPLNLVAADTQSLTIAGGAGNDALTVDSTAGAFGIPIITFNGGSGGTNSLALTDSLHTGTSATYTPGPAAGAGSYVLGGVAGTETINFTNLSPVYDSVAGVLTVDVNNTNSTVTYGQGNGPVPSPGTNWGEVSVGSLEGINFTHKTSLIIAAPGGNDAINLSSPSAANTPSGLTGITVTGDTSATDTLLVNGVAALSTVYTATSPGAGSVAVGALPGISFSGIGGLAINGQAGGGLLTVSTPAGGQVTLSPGSAVDSGTVAITSGGPAPVSFTPLDFSNLGAAGSLIVSGAGTLVYDGTASSDAFTVTGANTPAGVVGKVVLANSASPAVSQIPVYTTASVTNLVLNGAAGQASFTVTATPLALPYSTGITLEGGSSDASVANLNGNGSTGVTATLGVTAPSAVTTITGGGLGTLANPLTLTGVGVINVNANTAGATVDGTSANDSFTYSPTTASSGTVTLPGSPVVNFTNVAASGLTIDPLGGSNSVTVDVPAGTQSITASGGSSPVVTVTGALPLNLVAADTQSLTIAGGAGNDALTVDSTAGAFGIPIITFNGGSGGTNSLALTDSLHTGTSATYTPGPAAGAGSYVLGGVAGTETINFTNLSPVYDSVAGVLTVDVNNTNSTVTYGQGNGPVPSPGTNWGEVSVGSLEGINFTHKTSLIIAAPGGNDAINLSSPSAANTPSGLTGITVTGDTSATDTLLVNGASGPNTITYTPAASAILPSTVTVTGQPTVSFTGIGNLAVNGEGGGDDLVLDDANGANSVVLTPGAAVDSGTITVTSTAGGTASSATPLTYSNLGATGYVSISNPTLSPVSFQYNANSANETFSVPSPSSPLVPGSIGLSNTATGLNQIPVETTGVSILVLNGTSGNDTFDVTGSATLPYTSITLEGGPSDPPVANLTGDGSAITATMNGSLTPGGNPAGVTTVSGGGLGTINLTSVGIINLNAASGSLSVSGAPAGLLFSTPNNISVTPTVPPAGAPAGTTTAQIQDNDTSPVINVATAGGLSVGGSADTVTVNGANSSNQMITVATPLGGGAPTVQVNSLPRFTVNAGTSLVINSGLGAGDSVVVDSANGPVTVPIYYTGTVGAGDTLTLQGSTATTDTYYPSTIPGAGQSKLVFPAGTETVTFANLQPVYDTVGGALIVDGTSGNDTINYTTLPPNALYPSPTNQQYGYIAVNSAEPLAFTNKSTLTINGEGGDETITLNNPYVPSGMLLNGIIVNGGTGSSTLVVNANNQTVSSSQIKFGDVTPGVGEVTGIVGLPGSSPGVNVSYSSIALVHVINSKDTLTGTPASIPAVAGTQLNNVLVASFMYTDQPPAETSLASEFTATIDWGDELVPGTPNPDITGGTIIELAPTVLPGNPNPVVEFQVYGTHTYAAQGNYTATVTIYDTGSSRSFVTPIVGGTQQATITANPGTFVVLAPVSAIATVSSAPITATGVPTNQIVGQSTSTVVATITDPNPGASVANYTQTIPNPTPANPANITITWGDGSFTNNPVSAINPSGYTVTQVPGSSPAVFTVSAPHTYAAAGIYTVTVTIYRYALVNGAYVVSGAAAVATSIETVSDQPLTPVGPQPTVRTDEATIYPTPEFGAAAINAVPTNNPFQVFSGPVATFNGVNQFMVPSENYAATIDWGDGTPQSAGTVTFTGTSVVGGVTLGDYTVSGTHTYATSGVNGGVGIYPITVYIAGQPPSTITAATLTVHNTADVTDNPLSVTGILNPASDTGKSNTDGITYDTQPNFYGTVYATLPNGTQVPDPYAHVTLYANGVAVGYVQAGSDGTWSITSNALAQGSYTITANAVDQFGQTVSPMATIYSNLVIDTTPPVITSLSFDRFDATLTVVYQDNVAMNIASIINSEFYHISATPLVSDVHVPNLILPSSIYYTPGPTPNSPITVNVVFDKGKVFRGGKYEVVIDSGTGNSGVQDLAGNALAGTYYGQFPTGDGRPGGNFQADILTFHNKVLPFIPIGAGYSPPPKGIDPPAGSSLRHGKRHKTVHVRQKSIVHRSTAISRVAAQKLNSSAVDNALRELVAESKATHHKK